MTDTSEHAINELKEKHVKPREWRLFLNHGTNQAVVAQPGEITYWDGIHVIEMAAYRSIEQKLASLKTSLEVGKAITNVALDERDALQAKLARADEMLEQMSEALNQIKAQANMTRLADCCVDKTCHLNAETGICSFQTGVHYGNADQAGRTEDALAAYAKYKSEGSHE